MRGFFKAVALAAMMATGAVAAANAQMPASSPNSGVDRPGNSGMGAAQAPGTQPNAGMLKPSMRQTGAMTPSYQRRAMKRHMRARRPMMRRSMRSHRMMRHHAPRKMYHTRRMHRM